MTYTNRLHFYVGLPLAMVVGSLLVVSVLPLYEKIRRKLKQLFGHDMLKDHKEELDRKTKIMHLRERCVRAVVIIMFGMWLAFCVYRFVRSSTCFRACVAVSFMTVNKQLLQVRINAA